MVAGNDPSAPQWMEAGAFGLARLLGDSCITSLLSADGRWLHPLGLADPDPEVARALESFGRMRLSADEGFGRRVFESRRSLCLAATSAEVVRAGRPELGFFVNRFGVRGLIVAPMRARGRPVGHVAALRIRNGRPYCRADVRFVEAVADVLAVGIASARSSSRLPPGALAGSLSAREREVLGLLAHGHTNREIAERLVLSVRTVEWHRARLQWKLGVSGRAALATIARSYGLVD
jgi:DNA-binding CsgD family transcriptional regulator